MKTINRLDVLQVPLFVGSMLAEHALLKRMETREPTSLDHLTKEELSDPSLPADPVVPIGYERKDTTASLLMLLGSVAVNLTAEVFIARNARFLYKHRLFTQPKGKKSLLKAMLLWDFLYYWDHRFMHQVRLFWASHVPHHSSRRFNFATALRQPSTEPMMSWMFTPMHFLGFDAETSYKAAQIDLIYMLFFHTEIVDRLPAPFEAIFVSPSHHRVHHGANPQYLDKNYAGGLIIWDKIFGTFEPEVRQVKYGLTKNVDSYNPITLNFHEFIDIAKDVAKADNWRDRFGYVFRGPGWRPNTLPKADSNSLDPAHA